MFNYFTYDVQFWFVCCIVTVPRMCEVLWEKKTWKHGKYVLLGQSSQYTAQTSQSLFMNKFVSFQNT